MVVSSSFEYRYGLEAQILCYLYLHGFSSPMAEPWKFLYSKIPATRDSVTSGRTPSASASIPPRFGGREALLGDKYYLTHPSHILGRAC